MWIGDNRLTYGLLVTPVFRDQQWENDKSEIRAVKFNYWTIGHVMHTGLVLPGKNKKYEFNSVSDYLSFFEKAFVQLTNSPYEQSLAECYCNYVSSSQDKNSIPLMIPQFRYGGLSFKHEYRLDFTIINPYTLAKVGIEISPWVTHGELVGIKKLQPREINAIAQKNFEIHAEKVRSYFKKFNITVISYTDAQLQNSEELFNSEVVPLLNPRKPIPIISFEMKQKYGLL